MAKESKGERISSVRTAGETPEAVRALNIQRAYFKGQNPWITLPNPNKENTKERMIRVRANDLMLHPKEREKRGYRMGGGKEE